MMWCGVTRIEGRGSRPFRPKYVTYYYLLLSYYFPSILEKTEANCDSTALTLSINGIEASISSTQADIDRAGDTKQDLRLAIGCRNNTGIRSKLFEYYEALCKQTVFMKNVLTDLKIKVEILKRERERCQDRSKFISKTT